MVSESNRVAAGYNAAEAGTSAGLLRRVASGDARATREFIRVYGSMVWSLALRSAFGDRAEAEDAVQEIFVEVWRSAAKYDPAKGSESLFIAMIARRRLIDRFRARVPDSVAIDDVELAVEDEFVQATEVQSEFQAVRQGLKVLRPEERRVLDLGFNHGLSQSEIAEKTGLPLGTVKSLMRRGLIRLREWMLDSGAAREGQ